MYRYFALGSKDSSSFELPIIYHPSMTSIKSSLFTDSIQAEDVGLGDVDVDDERGYGFFGRDVFKNLYSSRSARWSLSITYLHIYECDSFTVR